MKTAKPIADKPRSARKLVKAGPHWKTRPYKVSGADNGFSWESDIIGPTFAHLELDQARNGALFLTDPNESPVDSLLVCQVTMAEAWNYIAARYLPPRLRGRFAKSVANALAGLDGCADLTDTEGDLLRKVSAWNGATVRAYVSQALRDMIRSDVDDVYTAAVLANDPTPAAVKYWREVEPLALKAGLHPFPNGSPSQAAGDGRAGVFPHFPVAQILNLRETCRNMQKTCANQGFYGSCGSQTCETTCTVFGFLNLPSCTVWLPPFLPCFRAFSQRQPIKTVQVGREAKGGRWEPPKRT